MTEAKRRPPRTNDPRELEAWRRGQDDDNFNKANKVIGGVENNIGTLTSNGDIQDGGSSIADIENKLTRRSFFFARNY